MSDVPRIGSGVDSKRLRHFSNLDAKELRMRALCAAIMTAGALIGLGLTALGLGMRYAGVGTTDPTHIVYVRLSHLDTPMMLILVVLLAATVTGIAAVFLGLAYHHERRYYERHASKGEGLGSRLGE
jgi:hypothetical protein